MIIVEGPDGAGKTTLINTLVEELFDMEVAPRVVSKDTKALVNLRDWVDANLAKGFQYHTIYDRHRLISDPIYRFKIPGKSMDSDFYEPQWLATSYLKFRAIRPIIIFCLPPVNVVRDNLRGDKDNASVIDHIDPIYYDYVSSMARYLADAQYQTLIHDYTRSNSLQFIVNSVETLLSARRNEDRRRAHHFGGNA